MNELLRKVLLGNESLEPHYRIESMTNYQVDKLDKRMFLLHNSEISPYKETKVYSSATLGKFEPVLSQSIKDVVDIQSPRDKPVESMCQDIKPSMLKLGRLVTDLLRPWHYHNTELLLHSIKGDIRVSQMVEKSAGDNIRSFESHGQRTYWSSCADENPKFANSREMGEIIALVQHLEEVYLIVGYQTHTNSSIREYRSQNETSDQRPSRGNPDPEMPSTSQQNAVLPISWNLDGERVAAICVRKVRILFEGDNKECLDFASKEWVVYWGPVKQEARFSKDVEIARPNSPDLSRFYQWL